MRYDALVALLGPEKARRLVEQHGGERLPQRSVAARELRNQRIIAALDAGATEEAAGERGGVSRRQVTRIAKRT